MTNQEFSDQFDVLYNNITSNQAPGLDEYEKSVFLTKAQDEIVKSYFNPRSNKTQEGFDGNEKRQIDFSMIMRSAIYAGIKYTIKTVKGGDSIKLTSFPDVRDALVKSEDGNYQLPSNYTIDTSMVEVRKGITAMGKPQSYVVYPFVEGFFDMRDNTKSVILNKDILMFINEYVEVVRNSSTTRLTILPVNYTEYSRLMNKPFKRPLKNQAWRLLESSGGKSTAELIVGAGDEITKYVIRYIKRPQAIILDNLDGVTLDGKSTAQTCELDPILHEEILQRAVELAKAAYVGDLQSQIALGGASQTNIGFVSLKQ